jgi:hypothetical protein
VLGFPVRVVLALQFAAALQARTPVAQFVWFAARDPHPLAGLLSASLCFAGDYVVSLDVAAHRKHLTHFNFCDALSLSLDLARSTTLVLSTYWLAYFLGWLETARQDILMVKAPHAFWPPKANDRLGSKLGSSLSLSFLLHYQNSLQKSKGIVHVVADLPFDFSRHSYRPSTPRNNACVLLPLANFPSGRGPTSCRKA